MNPNFNDFKDRKRVLEEINSDENYSRKREHQKRFDVYRQRQDVYIMERLSREFSPSTVSAMRKILSINLAPRIVDSSASIYSKAPERSFSSKERKELSESENAQIEALYKLCGVDIEMRKANRFYKLHDQCAIMIVPDTSGIFKVRAIPPHHYDVVPDAMDQEKPYAYILNVWDYDLNKSVRNESSEPTQLSRYRQRDNVNQIIADDDDRKKEMDRYVVWTSETHFTMNGKGKVIGEIIPNPIGRLPFVDVAMEKDFQFFVRRGTSVVDFALDFGLMLSDLANIVRLQGYSQAVIASEKQPTDVVVGPQKVLWLQLDPNRPEARPSFEFATPSPDLAGSLEFLEMNLRMFLSSQGLDPGTISGKSTAKSYSSGLERLLAMLDRFEASRSDFDLFRKIELEVFDLLRAWSNFYQIVSGPGELVPQLRNGQIGDDVAMTVQFAEPVSVQTKAEIEDSVIKQLDMGLMSRKEAIIQLRGVDEEKAEQILREIDGVDNGRAEISEEEDDERQPRIDGET